MIIAIDGTLASGKGTIARSVAQAFGLPHLDTGKLYRAVGVAALRRGIPLDKAERLEEIASGLDLNEFEDADLRTAAAGMAASKVAVLQPVRDALLAFQRRFAIQPGGAVLDGRDIGTVICPDADVKLWIDADIDERARRRAEELTLSGRPISQEEMLAQLEERDRRDRERDIAPMQRAENAVLIDTTDLSIEAAVEKARAVIEAVRAKRESRF